MARLGTAFAQGDVVPANSVVAAYYDGLAAEYDPTPERAAELARRLATLSLDDVITIQEKIGQFRAQPLADGSATVGPPASPQQLAHLYTEVADGFSTQYPLQGYYRGIALRYWFTADELAGINKAMLGLSADDADKIRQAWKDYIPSKSLLANDDADKSDVSTLFEAIASDNVIGAITASDHFRLAKRDLDTVYLNGWTPLMAAAAANAPGLAALLVLDHADVNAPGSDLHGFTALHIAALKGADAAVRYLLVAGAHAAITTADGTPASYIARKSGFTSLASQLEDAEQQDVVWLQTRLNQLGYSVGKPDGKLGPMTRMQLQIFAHGAGLAPASWPTAAVVKALAAAKPSAHWGWAVSYLVKGGFQQYWNDDEQTADRNVAWQAALDGCKKYGGTKCQVLFAVPSGSCVALSRASSDGSLYWSSIRPDLDSAVREAEGKCTKSSCTAYTSFCVP
jgi:hypothetical protein